MSNWLLDDPSPTSGAGNWLLDDAGSTSDNWLLDGPSTDTGNYNVWRGGAIDFVESAVGLGDELDALIRRSSGEAATFEEGLEQSRATLDRFEKENEVASKLITGAGLVSSFLIPGATAAKIAQTGSRAARAAKMAGLGAAEGAAYGYASGRGEERAEGAAFGGVIGGALGGAIGRYLTKNADEIADVVQRNQQAPGAGSYIGGEEGFAEVGRVQETKAGLMNNIEESTERRSVMDIDPRKKQSIAESPERNRVMDTLSAVALNTKAWTEKNVGKRAARLLEDAELIQRNEQRVLDDLFDDNFLKHSQMLEENKGMKSMLSQVGSKSKQKLFEAEGGKVRMDTVSWADVKARARTSDDVAMVDQLKEITDQLKVADFAIEGVEKTDDYFPRLFTGAKAKDGAQSVEDYANPVAALKNMAEDISAARSVALRFGIDPADITVKKSQTRLQAVIRAVEKKAVEEGASEAVAGNLADALRTTMITSKRGGDAVGAVARKLTSATLLANPVNAALNIIEGVTAPIYQNGVKAWAKQIPGAIKSTLTEKLAIKDKSWLSNHEIGLDKQFMGELSALAEQENRKIADNVSKFLYKWSGVQTVNRVGQEMLSNSAIQRGMDLAKKGDLDKLRDHPGMRGLTEQEFRSTAKALAAASKSKDLSNPSVRNFAAVSLNAWQPVSATAMPKAFSDNPNGRVFYSMLSYMNRQMNAVRTEIGHNLLRVEEYGINSADGQKAFKAAMKNGTKYAVLFGGLAGVWDDARKELYLDNDTTLAELFTPDGISGSVVNQFASNMSSGLINVRSERYGGRPVEPIPAPISAAMDIGSSLWTAGERAVTGEDSVAEPLLRSAQKYVPGISAADRLTRMGLFDLPNAAAEVRLPNQGGRLFEELGFLK
jgi:hypothetical protein